MPARLTKDLRRSCDPLRPGETVLDTPGCSCILALKPIPDHSVVRTGTYGINGGMDPPTE